MYWNRVVFRTIDIYPRHWYTSIYIQIRWEICVTNFYISPSIILTTIALHVTVYWSHTIFLFHTPVWAIRLMIICSIFSIAFWRSRLPWQQSELWGIWNWPRLLAAPFRAFLCTHRNCPTFPTVPLSPRAILYTPTWPTYCIDSNLGIHTFLIPLQLPALQSSSDTSCLILPAICASQRQ